MRTLITLVCIVALTFTSCRSYYTTKNFDEVAASHRSIAVLPFEIRITGMLPPEMTEEDIDHVLVNESLAFQTAFYHDLITRNRRRKTPAAVSVQHYNVTRQRIEDSGLTILDSWDQTPEYLAQILEVDAVVFGRIEKEQFFSDALSVGIDIGTSILTDVGSTVLSEIGLDRVPLVSKNNKNVRADYAVLNGADGAALWSINAEVQADWQQTTDQIARNVIRHSTWRFPYNIH